MLYDSMQTSENGPAKLTENLQTLVCCVEWCKSFVLMSEVLQEAGREELVLIVAVLRWQVTSVLGRRGLARLGLLR